MKTDTPKRNWIIDAGLFGGFLAAMLLDLTGVGWHQWLGMALIGLGAYHLFTHWQWVKSVSLRLFRGLRGQPRRYLAIDALVVAGFALIGFTGLVISTWLDLPLGNYTVWRDAHVIASVATLVAVVVKIGMHWRWIVNIATRRIFNTAPRTAGPIPGQPAAVPARIGRRQFMLLMGATCGSALLAAMGVLVGDGSAEAARASSNGLESASVSTPALGTQDTTWSSASTESSSASSCTVRCRRRCSYPGHCRRYVDSDGNGLCDQGECQA